MPSSATASTPRPPTSRAPKKNQAKTKEPQEPKKDEDQEDQDKKLAAFVRAHTCARAFYEGVLPRPLPCEDDDDAIAAAREDAYDAHEAARARERARLRGARGARHGSCGAAQIDRLPSKIRPSTFGIAFDDLRGSRLSLS